MPTLWEQMGYTPAHLRAVGGGVGGTSSAAGYQPLLDASMNPNLYTSGAATGRSETYLPPEKQQAFATLNQFLQDPLQNITSRLGPLLRSLVPGEQQSRQGLLDVYRRAGGLRSGAMAQAARQLEGDILGRRAETATRASLGALGPMISGYGAALTGIPALTRTEETQQRIGELGRAGGGAGAGFGGFGDFGISNITGQPGGAIRGTAYDPFRPSAPYDPVRYGGVDPYANYQPPAAMNTPDPYTGAPIQSAGGFDPYEFGYTDSYFDPTDTYDIY